MKTDVNGNPVNKEELREWLKKMGRPLSPSNGNKRPAILKHESQMKTDVNGNPVNKEELREWLKTHGEKPSEINVFSPSDFCVFSGADDVETTHEQAARQANAKLNKLIAEWPVVFGRPDEMFSHIQGVIYRNGVPNSDTHKARLAFTEPLKPAVCEHVPADIVITDLTPWTKSITIEPTTERNCSKCGIKLVAKWEVAP